MDAARGNGVGWFLFQRVSGAALIVLLLFHFALMHFTGASLDHATASARLASGLYRAVDLTFLVLALGHGLYGVWAIAGDYLRWPWLRLAVVIACGLGGLFLTIMGAVTVLTGG